jgi:hypothetical protein
VPCRTAAKNAATQHWSSSLTATPKHSTSRSRAASLSGAFRPRMATEGPQATDKPHRSTRASNRDTLNRETNKKTPSFPNRKHGKIQSFSAGATPLRQGVTQQARTLTGRRREWARTFWICSVVMPAVGGAAAAAPGVKGICCCIVDGEGGWWVHLPFFEV